jgi:hypothetical protein
MIKKKLTVDDVTAQAKTRIKAILALPGDAKLARHLALQTDLDVDTCRSLLAAAAADLAKADARDSQRAAARIGSDRSSPGALTAFEQGKADMARARKLGFAFPPAPTSSVGGRSLGLQGIDE